MKKMNFNTRAYVTKNRQLMIRVRWNSKKNEVAFSVGYTIDPMKWDSTKQLVKANTTHYINNRLTQQEFFTTDALTILDRLRYMVLRFHVYYIR